MLGYKLKQTQHSLRLRMDEALKTFDLTTPQYAVLAQLELRPGISNAALARSSFITAQTMQDLCDANKVTAKYVQLILRLNFLALKLKEAILLGHQPRHMKLADLMQNIPSLWHEQGELFGCEVV